MRHDAATLAGLAVTAALVAGCGGSSSGTTAAAGQSTPPVSGTPGAGHGTATEHPQRPHAQRPAVGASPGPTAHTSARTAGTGPSHGGTDEAGDADTATSRFPMLDPGDYTYRVHGHVDTALGDSDYDGRSRLTVTAPAADRRHATLRGKDGTTKQTLLGRRGGLYLADLEMSQQGFDSEFRPESPVLLFPAGAQVGDHWSWQMRSTDGDYTLHATLRLAADDGRAEVDGSQVRTVTVKATLVLDGKDFSMTLHQTDEATDGGLVVHEHTVGDGTAYGTPVHTEADRRLI